jgi:hypothetical protein
MAIKLKKSGRLRAEIKVEEKTVASEDIPLPGPSLGKDQPYSVVGVNLGYKKSRDFQSVNFEVKVEVPTWLGKEHEGLEYATFVADKFLESKEKEVDGYLRSLA